MATRHALMTARGLAVVVAFAFVGCSLPPKTPQEQLIERAPYEPVSMSKGLAAGAEASFGSTAIRIETAASGDKPHDLSKEAVGDAVALAASSAADMEAFAGIVRDAAGGVSRASATVTTPTHSIKVSASERVRQQSAAVHDGASKVEKVAAATANTLALVSALGVLLGSEDQKQHLQIAAETRGRPYRASCATSIHIGTIDRLSKPSLACVVVRADIVPVREWKISASTFGDAVNGLSSTGKLEPSTTKSATAFWFTRPDKSIPLMRTGFIDTMCFDVHRESGPPVARLCGVDGTTSPSVSLDLGDVDKAAGGDPESGDALAVTMAILAILPWPDLHPKDEQK